MASSHRAGRWYRSRLVALPMIVAALVTGAGASPSAAAVWPPSNTAAQTVSINSGNAAGTDLTLTSKTIEVPSSLLKSVTGGGTTYTFSSASGPLAKVAVGKVILIEGQDAIVVTSVKHAGGQLVVGAAPASIGDVIESGQLKVTGPPDMAQAVGVTDTSSGLALAPMLRSTGAAGARRPNDTLAVFPSYSYSGKTSTFSYSLTFAGAPNGIHVTGTICYACASLLNINAKLDGTFTWANQDLDMDLAGGKVKSGSFGISGMSSDLDLTFRGALVHLWGHPRLLQVRTGDIGDPRHRGQELEYPGWGPRHHHRLGLGLRYGAGRRERVLDRWPRKRQLHHRVCPDPGLGRDRGRFTGQVRRRHGRQKCQCPLLHIPR